MRFEFQLEGVLRVRTLLENQARERLESSISHMHALEQSLHYAHLWREKTEQVLARKAFLPACEFQFVEMALRQASEAIQNCERLKKEAEAETSVLRDRYLSARRDRETLSTLRDRALSEFNMELARREQASLDDIFAGRSVYLRTLQEQTTALSGLPADATMTKL